MHSNGSAIVRTLVMVAFTTTGLAGCATDPGGGCEADRDCADGRVCEDGTCITPGQQQQPDGGTPRQDAATAPVNVVGLPCNSDSVCAGLPGSYCSRAGVCTRECSYHSDCGCPPSTSTGDIAAGKCKASCMVVADGYPAYCLRVCATTADCFGTTSCNSSGSGYGTCL